MLKRLRGLLSLAVAAGMITGLTACGGLPAISEPVGDPLLPDLVPEPPVDLRVRAEEEGRLHVRFSSTLVNVGDGDFVLRANRSDDGWDVQQEVWFDEAGAELIDTTAELHWGGDGHEHWHVRRVATYTLYKLDEDGNIVEDDIALPDAKVGFCFYDHSPLGKSAGDEGVYEVDGCGHEEDTELRMGMSPGWADIYGFDLPGQSIDITDLPDGAYRVIAEADPDGWFTEASRENNITWIDIELSTLDGNRFAGLTDVGPSPSGS